MSAAVTSEKWETVKTGKPAVKGGNKAGNGSAANGGHKKVVKPLPKMEDVLPTGSMKTMYAEAFQSPPSPKVSPKKAAGGGKQEQLAAGGKKKKEEAAKVPVVKAPVTLQEAVKANLRLDDLKQLVDASQQKFPDSPLLWLRDVVAYLNLKLEHENKEGESCTDPLASTLPLSALTVNMRKLILGMLNNCSDQMRETFVETCIANTAHDMAKGLDVVGWRMMSQALADNYPQLVVASIPRFTELRNSYQNRPAIGLAILWSVGQAGKKDLQAGVKLWMELMLPLITMKHYTKFVVEYMEQLLGVHSVTPGYKPAKPFLDIPSFITLQDTLLGGNSNINKEYLRQLRAVYPSLRNLALGGCSNHELFPALMDKMSTHTMPDQLLDTLDVLSDCLVGSQAALVHWHKLYTTHLSQSAQLLQYINSNWNKYKTDLRTPTFEDTVEAFQDFNMTAPQKEEVGRCREACTALSAKLYRRKGSWFPWKTVSFLLLVATASIVNLDIQKNGNFKKSHTGQFLADIGQYERVVSVYERGQTVYTDTAAWTRANYPIYYEKTRQVVGPSLDTATAKFQELSGEAVKLGERGLAEVKHGVAALSAHLPTLQARVGEAGQWVGKRAEKAGQVLGAGLHDLLQGKVDWNDVKTGAIERLEVGRQMLEQLYTWLRQQVNQILK